MQILVIRHAAAEDDATFARRGNNDDLRPLTAKGRVQMQRHALGLRRVADIDLVAHSPLLRAAQTARIISDVIPAAKALETAELAPGSEPEAVAQWLGFVSRHATVALVGHEPDLGELLAWFATGTTLPFMTLKKGGAVMLGCDRPKGPGCATMQWALTPKQLRILANCR